jgi:hypothetical protein
MTCWLSSIKQPPLADNLESPRTRSAAWPHCLHCMRPVTLMVVTIVIEVL